MLELGVMTWLRKECRVQQNSVTANTGLTTAFGADPDRFGLIVRTDATAAVLLVLTEVGSDKGSWSIPTTIPSVVFSEDQLGQLITGPVVVNASTGTPQVVVTTMSYLPHRKRIYEHLIRKYLSDSGAL